MALIELQNAAVSYFLRKPEKSDKSLERGAVGGQILIRSRYLEIAALKDISVRLTDGDRVGLIGLNGSGKSTFLKLCAGAVATNSGSAKIIGGVSPQFSLGAGIKPTLSGRWNAELKCLYMGLPQSTIPARVEQVKKLSGLGGYFELPVSSYSAGMRSRLVMSLLCLVRAEILVMDEWIGAADGTVNKTIAMLQSELIGNAKILVLASHSFQVLGDWTTKLIWLEQGQIREIGPTAEVFAKYREWQGAAVRSKQ